MAFMLTRAQVVRCAISCVGSLACLGVTGCSGGLREMGTIGVTDSLDEVLADEQMEAGQRLLEHKTNEYEEQILPYRVDVPLGQTVTLANVDAEIVLTNPKNGENIVSTMADFVNWDGEIEVRIDGVMLYDSMEDAMGSEELGSIAYAKLVGEVDEPVLVMHTTLRNVDAVSRDETGCFDVNFLRPTYIPAGSDGSIFVVAELAAFDGAPKEADVNERLTHRFELIQGETRALTTTWRFPLVADFSTLKVRPSLSATNPGPVVFLLGEGFYDETDV